jgi:hypothetical protein
MLPPTCLAPAHLTMNLAIQSRVDSSVRGKTAEQLPYTWALYCSSTEASTHTSPHHSHCSRPQLHGLVAATCAANAVSGRSHRLHSIHGPCKCPISTETPPIQLQIKYSNCWPPPTYYSTRPLHSPHTADIIAFRQSLACVSLLYQQLT